MRTTTKTQTTYLALTRRLQGAYASGDAYRTRRATLGGKTSDKVERPAPPEAAPVVPFRPR